VRQQLDQLIEAHHPAGTHLSGGSDTPGTGREQGTFAGTDRKQAVVSGKPPYEGEPGSLPILALEPDLQTIRLRPGAERKVTLYALPHGSWSQLESIEIRTEPPIAELALKATDRTEGRN
jgi:hypothetical protein